MTHIIYCPIKFNLTLRVLSGNPAGFHEIFSIFWKKTAAEVLTIEPLIEENISDVITMPGVPICGVNLVAKAIGLARGKNNDIPPLRVTISKEYPPGSGIGAGSGNAAAMVTWLRENYNFCPEAEAITKLGADVTFLSSPHKLALARGIGDILTRLGGIPEYFTVIAFPVWTSGTKKAFGRLDELREDRGLKIVSIDECRAEASSVHSALLRGEKIGLLPNDFLEIFGHDQLENYNEAFAISDRNDALAWGLCGSGSAIFALFAREAEAKLTEEKFKQLGWIKKIAKLG